MGDSAQRKFMRLAQWAMRDRRANWEGALAVRANQVEHLECRVRALLEENEELRTERDRLRNVLRGLYGVATTPTQHYNEQPAAQAIADAIRRRVPDLVPLSPPGAGG